MKKIMTVLFFLFIAFSIAACGSKSATASKITEDSKKKTEVTTNNDTSNTSISGTTLPSSTPGSGGSEVASNNSPSSTTIESSSSVSSAPGSTTSSVPGNAATTAPTPVLTPTPTPKPTTVTVTIPEGFTVSQIGDRLAEKGVCTKADFLNAVNTYNFSYYSLVAQIPSNPNRAFKLEGYLFPNTYQFNLNKPTQDAVGVLIRGAQEKITSQYSYTGMTLDQIITLASIIQMESPNTAEMANISSAFHNRLKQGMRLQSDPTIYYIERYVKPIITGDINRYNSYYNTYKCAALPAGPI